MEGYLKPCPFCGGEARTKIDISGVDNLLYEVVCDAPFCPCYGKEDEVCPSGYVDKNEAIQAWNTRTIDKEALTKTINAFWTEWEAPSNDVYTKDLVEFIAKEWGKA